MKTLVCEEPGRFEYTAAAMPMIYPGRAIIRIKRIGVCGTDIHAFEGTQPYFTYPRILGHELSGVLVDADNAPGFFTGDKVSFIPYFNCGYCIACRSDKPNCCVSMQVFGVHMHGGMAEYISVPSRLLLHGDDLNFDELALVEPLAVGAHAVRRASVQPGEIVLVVGAGPIGLAAAEFARIAGASVIVMDTNANRLKFCKQHLKIDCVVNALDLTVMEQLQSITNGDMPAVVMDATGNLTAINNSFQYMAHGGRYVLIGLQKGNISFSHPEFHKREATLMSSRNATGIDFQFVISSIKHKHVAPACLITHRVTFDEVKDNFENWLNPATGVVKAIINMT